MKINFGSGSVLAVTVGEKLTRVVELTVQKKTPQIKRAFSFTTPEGIVSDGYVKSNDAYKQLFKAQCKKHGVTATQVAFTVDSAKIVTRDITIPEIKGNKIAAMIATNASDYFPIDISQHKLVYQILENAGGKMHLSIYAVPYDLIRSYMRLARDLELEVSSIDCLANASAQTVKIVEHELPKDPQAGAHHVKLFLTCSEGSTVMTFRRAGGTVLQRAVNFSFTETLAQIKKCLEADGKYKVQNPADEIAGRDLLYPSLKEMAKDAENGGDKAAITETIKPLISLLRRNLDYFFEQQEDPELTVSAYLTDLGAEFKGLDALLASALDIPVSSASFAGAKKYIVSGAAGAGSPFAAYASVFGGAIAPLPIAEKVKQDTVSLPTFFGAATVQRSVMALCGVVCAVCVGISICLAFMPAGQNAQLKDRSDKLAGQIAELGNPKQYYDLYQRMLTLANEVKGLEYAMDTNNNHLVSFLEEMETKMPKSFKAASFSVSETGVNMSVQVGSKQEAIFVIQTLREMESVKINSISGITETTVSSGSLLPATYAGEPAAQADIDVQAYLDMALALGKITRAEYDAYCKGECTQAELDKLKSFRDNGTITQEQYEAILEFIDERKNGTGTIVPPAVSGDQLLSEADVVSYLQMALMMNRFTQEQYDRLIAGKPIPDDLTLLEGYYRTGVITENQYASILAYIENKKNGGDENGTPVVSFTVSLTYTGIFEDGTVGKPAPETTTPETTTPETTAPETGA